MTIICLENTLQRALVGVSSEGANVKFWLVLSLCCCGTAGISLMYWSLFEQKQPVLSMREHGGYKMVCVVTQRFHMMQISRCS